MVSCGRPSTPQTKVITVDNAEPRRDVSGEIIDAHDGCLQFFAGKFYLYGTAYRTNDGIGFNNRYCVYSSPDLEHWTFEAELFKDQLTGIYYRPYVVFNARTGKYVLWYNWYPKLWDGQTGVAVSDKPIGPFTIVNPEMKVVEADSGIGDGSLFVDDDGTGYYIYTVIGKNYSVCVERLTPAYTGVTGEACVMLATFCEAPLLFRRNNLYYILADSLCAFCPQGSGAQVMMATTPLGPYRVGSNINRQSGNGVPIIPAQQTWVAEIPTSQGLAFIWMADRWQSTPDGVKGHDFQFWSAPLEFNTNGDILPIKNVGRWHIQSANQN